MHVAFLLVLATGRVPTGPYGLPAGPNTGRQGTAILYPGQVAGSPVPFYLTRQQADHNHQQQGGSSNSFSWLRVVQNRRPWASSVFPSTPLYRRGFIIVITPMWVYSFVRNGHGVGGMHQLFTGTLFVVQETTTTSNGASMHACISSRRFQASLYA